MRKALLLTLLICEILSGSAQNCDDRGTLCRSLKNYCDSSKLEKYLKANCRETCSQFCETSEPSGAGCEDRRSNCPRYRNVCNKKSLRLYLSKYCKKTCARYCDVSVPEWSDWSDYNDCSQTCGGGEQTRMRECSTGNNDDCAGLDSETRSCNEQPCPAWLDWEPYGTCTLTCGGGSQTRTRECSTGNDEDCDGMAMETRSCNDETCPPEWSDWSKYGACNASCEGGTQARMRECSTGDNGDCAGLALETRSCNEEACPDYSWSSWREWEPCTVSCGRGTQVRIKVCAEGDCPEQFPTEGRTCVASTPCPCGCSCRDVAGSASCSTIPSLCSVAAELCEETCGFCDPCICGIWSEWISTECSATCGGGNFTRTRTCEGDSGAICLGEASETVYCNLEACQPDDGTEWTSWSVCYPPCGPGKQLRTRGNVTISRTCIISTCPDIDGSYNCTRECGEGTLFNGTNYEDCNPEPCTISGTCPVQYGYQPRDGVNQNECCDNSNALSLQCGIQPSNARIVGGQNVEIHTWPWMAQLYVNGNLLCGAALINERHVLTAAHCVSLQDEIITNANITLLFGSNQLNAVDSNVNPHVQIRQPDQLFIQDDYDAVDLENDIAVIRLSEPVILSDSVKPICLPQGEQVKEDMQCYVAGWGDPSGDLLTVSMTLNEAAVRILPSILCEQQFLALSGGTGSIKNICSGRIASGTGSTCTVDAGGPLMCQRCSSCGYFAAGVVSLGLGCVIDGVPNLSMRVTYYEDWIYETIGEVPNGVVFPSC